MEDPVNFIGNWEEIIEEMLELTSVEQQKKILEKCLSLWSKWDIRILLATYAPEILEFRYLAKEGLTVKKILENTIWAQQQAMLRICLRGLTRPELRRLLYFFAKEVNGFNRLAKELEDRTVIPFPAAAN